MSAGHRVCPRVVVRPLHPGDESPLRTVFDGMSVSSRYRRFHTGTPALSSTVAARLVQLEPGLRESFVAYDGPTPVGIGRWLRAPGADTADLSLEVVDAWQGRGVGRALLHALAASAAAAGVAYFGVDLLDAHPLERTLVRLGARRDRDPWDLVLRVTALLHADAKDRAA